MKPLRSGNLAAFFASLLMFALLCGIVAYWALQLAGRKPSVAPPEIVADPRAGIDLAAAGGLFGAAPIAGSSAPPPEVANIQVIGIVADPARGAAILAVDGKPGKPFQIGDSIVPGTRLGAVRPDAVVIDRGGTRIDLAVPERPSVALLSSGPAAASSTAGRGGAARPMPLPPSQSSTMPATPGQPPAAPSSSLGPPPAGTPAAPVRPLPPSGSAAAAAAGLANPPPNIGQSGMAPPTVGTATPPGAVTGGMPPGTGAMNTPPVMTPGAAQPVQPGGQATAQ